MLIRASLEELEKWVEEIPAEKGLHSRHYPFNAGEDDNGFVDLSRLFYFDEDEGNPEPDEVFISEDRTRASLCWDQDETILTIEDKPVDAFGQTLPTIMEGEPVWWWYWSCQSDCGWNDAATPDMSRLFEDFDYYDLNTWLIEHYPADFSIVSERGYCRSGDWSLTYCTHRPEMPEEILRSRVLEGAAALGWKLDEPDDITIMDGLTLTYRDGYPVVVCSLPDPPDMPDAFRSSDPIITRYSEGEAVRLDPHPLDGCYVVRGGVWTRVDKED